MSLTIVVLSLIVFAFRVKKGIVKREEKILWAIWFAHSLIVSTTAICVHPRHCLDTRYVKPADCLVWGAAVWALLQFRFGKPVLVAILGVLVVYNAVMFTKHLVPGSRRHSNLVACQWAMRRISADRCDKSGEDAAKKMFTVREYTSGGSPAISPISKRMNYLLGARNANPVFGKKLGTPDYIVEEDKRLKFEPWDKNEYILMDELQIKKRHYSLYKRRDL